MSRSTEAGSEQTVDMRLLVPRGAEHVTVSVGNAAGKVTKMYLSYAQWPLLHTPGNGSTGADFGTFEFSVRSLYFSSLSSLCLVRVPYPLFLSHHMQKRLQLY